MAWLRKDAALRWELEQIAQTGPNWREHIQAAEQAAGQLGSTGGNPFEGGGGSALGGETPAGGTSGTPASEIPNFGGEAGAAGAAGEAAGGEAPPVAPEAGGPAPAA